MDILDIIQTNNEFIIFNTSDFDILNYYINFNKDKIIWKSFGDNCCRQYGIGSHEDKIFEPTTFFEGKIYEFKFNVFTTYIKTIDEQDKLFGNLSEIIVIDNVVLEAAKLQYLNLQLFSKVKYMNLNL